MNMPTAVPAAQGSRAQLQANGGPAARQALAMSPAGEDERFFAYEAFPIASRPLAGDVQGPMSVSLHVENMIHPAQLLCMAKRSAVKCRQMLA